MIQIVQVVLPPVVQRLKHHEAHDPLGVLPEILYLPAEVVPGRLHHQIRKILPVSESVLVLLRVRKPRRHDEEVKEETLSKTGKVPFLRRDLGRAILLREVPGGVLDHLPNLALQALSPFQGKQPEIIDDLPLLVHDVIIIQQALPGLEVVALHSLLGLTDGLGHQAVGDDLPLLDPPLLHGPRYSLRHEEAHEVVLQGEEELGGSRISLAPRTPAELPVDSP